MDARIRAGAEKDAEQRTGSYGRELLPPLEKDSRSGETGRRSDPTDACIRAGAEKDVEQRRGS